MPGTCRRSVRFSLVRSFSLLATAPRCVATGNGSSRACRRITSQNESHRQFQTGIILRDFTVNGQLTSFNHADPSLGSADLSRDQRLRDSQIRALPPNFTSEIVIFHKQKGRANARPVLQILTVKFFYGCGPCGNK
jgi:hypothetical protein